VQALNLPPISHRVKESQGKLFIFDEVRRKYVRLTPEEWVRQHLMHYLMHQRKFPRSLIKVESGLTYNKMLKRTDLRIYDRSGLPYILAECKAPEEKLGAKAVMQVSTYNKEIKAPFIVLTNGMDLFCWSTNKKDPEFLPEVPQLMD
jgi:type I site-specific restriction endonuclease